VARVTDEPPPQVAADLRDLRSRLDAALPSKLLDRNLIIATWRWERFDEVTEKWLADAGDHAAARDLRAIRCLAEIVSHFDVLAVQGVMGDARGVGLVMDALGDDWGLMMSGLSRESAYNERTAFVFDTRKVVPRGLAGQVVLQDSEAKDAKEGRYLSRQFFRPPLFAGFRCLDRKFTLAAAHLVYGQSEERLAEVRAFVAWLAETSRKGYDWERNFIVLGQLQLMRSGTPLHDAFTEGGLRIPADLVDVPTFPADNPKTMASSIAWFGEGSGPAELDLDYLRGGVFEFADGLPLNGANLSRHLPVWAEFSVRRSASG
jgi:endonuclease/exonuclease/phosphatase family metal-dependent hydrolase